MEGAALVIVYVIYLYYLSMAEKTVRDEPELRRGALWVDISFLVGALVVVVLSSSVGVDEGLSLASSLGVSPFIIGYWPA